MLKLPGEIWGSRVMAMLKLVDVARLDSALISPPQRSRLFEIYRASTLITVEVGSDQAANWLINRGLKFDSLVVELESADTLLRLCRYYSTLQSLSIFCSLLSDVIIDQITADCTHLVHLALGNWSTRMSPTILNAVARNCPHLHKLQLKELKLSHECESIFLNLVISCPLLEEIELDLTNVPEQALIHIATHCKHLKRVGLENSRTVGAVGLTSIAQHCPDLEKLSLAECEIPNAVFIAVAECCKKLQHLYLYSVQKLGDLGLIALAKCNPGLKKVSLLDLDCTDIAIEALCEYCPLIERLHIDCNKQIKGRVLPLLAMNLHNLRKLNISDGVITDEDIAALATSCRGLESLMICKHNTEPVPDRILKVVVRSCRKLRELALCMNGRTINLQKATEIARSEE